MKDLRKLPKVRDSWTFLYLEHCRIDQDKRSVAAHDANGKVPIPCATLTTLMLGPGTRITHAAVRTLADNGCLVLWVGEENRRFYALGMGETRSSRNLQRQARLWADPALHLWVVRQLYSMRFPEPLEPALTLAQIRGKEGIRVRNAYARASKEAGVPWDGRSYKRDTWDAADLVNRALSTANSCLYGVCHAAIVSAGFSPALGFIHTGKMLSFVYDVGDLYKAEMTIPAAFHVVGDEPGLFDVEGRVRHRCREIFHDARLLQRIIPDIERAFGSGASSADLPALVFDDDSALPGDLWSDEGEDAAGGVNYGDGEGAEDGGDLARTSTS